MEDNVAIKALFRVACLCTALVHTLPAHAEADLCADLECAIHNGDLAGTIELLSTGSDPNLEIRMDRGTPSELDHLKAPALMVAVARGDQEIAIELLRAGADTNGGERLKHTALTAASMKNQLDVVNHILMNGLEDVNQPVTGAKPFNALAFAVALGHREMAHTLLEFGANPNSRSVKNELSALSETLSSDDESYMVKLLIDYGLKSGAETDASSPSE